MITLRLLLALGTYFAMMAPAVRAQAPAAAPPVPDGPRYVVTYLEVKQTEQASAATLVRKFRDATRKEPGNLRADALQRIGQLHQFALLEVWSNSGAAEAHAKATATAQFRDKFKGIQNAPVDEREHFPLSVGPVTAKGGGAAVAVVTHVDVIPRNERTEPRSPSSWRRMGARMMAICGSRR